ncbi:MAG: MaoC family dehydratase N-terminal domain-containing protein [Hyphomicrobiales bacterium]|jgi:3-methylfumaryl-CoA hydratase|nr:MaoC family dehydratase N-terminal domain-containing protein [Hyphomicrobiales bacterium]
MDETQFAEWIGRKSESVDIVTPRLAASYRAIFGDRLAPVGADEAPLGIHWCLSPAIAPMEALGPDGHPAKNRDLPPIPQPRRMWAGGSLETLAPIRVGDTVTRISTIGSITRKEGRSGELWFVAVHHDYVTPRGTAIRERHDIVYREAAKPGTARTTAPEPAPAAEPVEGEWLVETPSTLLFRYSAITFNGHRIHYDLPYVTGVEGYAGLVVHGPIQATLLLNFATASLGRVPERFSYRGVAPAIAGSPVRVRKTPDTEAGFRTESVSGTVHMEATAG